MKKSQQKFPMAGADEKTPSKAMYFSWINHAWEGANEPCTVASLNFFQWLHDEYGMKLDIYLLDAGTIDGLQVYGTTDSAGYHERFPRGLKPMVSKAAGFGSRLGMWMGPDGFGTTAKEEQARRDMIVAVARDHDMALFKFDGCCGNLRDDRSDSFARMMTEVRRHCPDLIALNHRINLDANALKHMTTWLWQGVETYIDVHIANSVTAPHNRAAAMSRGLPPELSRLTEDHGVCLSSCLDYWEDDLVLQAFNRCLILAPEIYGNPWLLRDDEMPRLARLFNLHRRYRDILVNGMELPATYGPNAVSRGDAGTRMVTLTNLSWKAKAYTIELGAQIGLTDRRPVTVRQFHPGEKALGTFAYGSHVKVIVPAFRSCLVLATVKCIEEPGIVGGTFEVVRDVPGRPVELKLLGLPGTKAKIRLPKDGPQFAKAVLDGKNAAKILAGGSIDVTFPGRAFKKPFHRKLASLKRSPVPRDAEALYEATCFAADNDALEIRSLRRSGESKVPQIRKAREAFFNQKRFVELGISDRHLFDGRKDTFFQGQFHIRGGALRLDLGAKVRLDTIVVTNFDAPFDLAALGPASVSADLKTWTPATMSAREKVLTVAVPGARPVRYLRISGSFGKIADIAGRCGGKRLDRSAWRASMTFGPYEKAPATRVWSARCKLDEIAANSYIAVAVNGRHGPECAYAALRVAGKPVGAPDRAVSYHSAVWEACVREHDANYTYYIPVTPDMKGKPIDVVVMQVGDQLPKGTLKPEAWITAYPVPYASRTLLLSRE